MHNEAIATLSAAKATIHAEIQNFRDLKLRLEAGIAQKERELESIVQAHTLLMHAAPVEFTGEQATRMAERFRRTG